MFLIFEAIRTAKIPTGVQVARDGEQAIRLFEEVEANAQAPCPALVILDINLPRRSGGQVLEYMRKTRRCRNAKVIVVSTSDSPRDREEMSRLGANDYFRKPSEYDEFMKLGAVVKDLLAA